MTRKINMNEAIGRLQAEVEYRGGNYRYLDDHDSCLYMEDSDPQCLVGGALYRERPWYTPLAYADDCEASIAYSYPMIEAAGGVKFTKGALLVLAAAQGAQDAGATHQQASSAALRVQKMLRVLKGGY